jgi:hypothetical protein
MLFSLVNVTRQEIRSLVSLRDELDAAFLHFQIAHALLNDGVAVATLVSDSDKLRKACDKSNINLSALNVNNTVVINKVSFF